MPRPTHAEIAREAYFIWLAQGRPEARALEHWFRAERWLAWQRVRPPFLSRALDDLPARRHAR